MVSSEVQLSDSKIKLHDGIMLFCPSHGLGRVVSVTKKECLGKKLTFCDIEFTEDNMKISIPLDKMKGAGIRTIISEDGANKILKTVLDKPAKSAKSIWTKRIQEYETKLYSGSAIFIAEIVRDLFAGMKDSNKSYGERLLFDKAFNRLVCEFSVALKITPEEASKQIINVLNRNYKASHDSKMTIDKNEEMDGDFDDDDLDDEEEDDENERTSDKKSA